MKYETLTDEKLNRAIDGLVDVAEEMRAELARREKSRAGGVIPSLGVKADGGGYGLWAGNRIVASIHSKECYCAQFTPDTFARYAALAGPMADWVNRWNDSHEKTRSQGFLALGLWLKYMIDGETPDARLDEAARAAGWIKQPAPRAQ